jgi:uncharacterized Zn-binding protein involved in type VI secretion
VPPVLTTASKILCLHGGKALPTTGSLTVLAESSPVITLGETMTVHDCPLRAAATAVATQAQQAMSEPAATGKRHVFTVPTLPACHVIMAITGINTVLVEGKPLARDLTSLQTGTPAIVVGTATVVAEG